MLAGSLALQLWLARRHAQHVAAHRDARSAGVCRPRRVARAPEGRRLHGRAHAARDRRGTRRNGIAAGAHGGRRPRRCSSRGPASLPFGGLARDLALIVAVVGDLRHRRPAVLVCADVRHRSEVRLQPDDARALDRRPRQGRPRRRRAGSAAGGAGAVADARRGTAVVDLGVGGVDRIPVPDPCALSDGDRAAVQQVLAAAGGLRARRDRARCSRAAVSRTAASS